eukprot:9026589-Heterocapsa_arctica.AAC.1
MRRVRGNGIPPCVRVVVQPQVFGPCAGLMRRVRGNGIQPCLRFVALIDEFSDPVLVDAARSWERHPALSPFRCADCSPFSAASSCERHRLSQQERWGALSMAAFGCVTFNLRVGCLVDGRLGLSVQAHAYVC